MFDIKKLASIQIKIADPDTIRRWSKGEVKNAETIDYKKSTPKEGGLFDQVIFGPVKDYTCACVNKGKKKRQIGSECPDCHVEILPRTVRRERMGSIELGTPCTHIWFLRGTPSRINLLLDPLTTKEIDDIAYYVSHVVYDAGIYAMKIKGETEGTRGLFDKINLEGGVAVKQIFKVGEKGCEFRIRLQNIFKDITTGKINQLIDYAQKMKDDPSSTRAEVEYYSKFAKLKRYVPVDENGEITDFYAPEYMSRALDEEDDIPLKDVIDIITSYTGVCIAMGGEAIRSLLSQINLDEEILETKRAIEVEKEKKLDSNAKTELSTKLVRKLETLVAFKKSKMKPEWMVLTVLPVLPPELRPLLQLDGGRFTASDLNELYRKVILANNKLKDFSNSELRATDVIINNQKRSLQSAVDALIENGKRNKAVTNNNGRELKCLTASLKGKTGRFRNNLLGKRVDYSGRSVIAVGPNLKMHQCGIPVEMAVRLLEPFIICELTKMDAYRGMKAETALKYINDLHPDVLKIIDRIISKHPVLLNRAPTLHRLGIQAFQPILVEGRAIRLHPLVCTGFNADFDGDQMAVHVPLSKAAQEEALTLMLASNNILSPSSGKPICTPTQDMVLGNFYLSLESTCQDFLDKAKSLEDRGVLVEAEKYRLYADSEGKVFRNVEDLLLAYNTKQIHLHNRIAILGSALKKVHFTKEMNNSYLVTTVGKVIFNLIFPNDFPFVNETTREIESINIDTGEKTTETRNFPDLYSDVETGNYCDHKYFVPRGTNIKEYIAALPLKKPIDSKGLESLIGETFLRYDRKGNPKTSAILDKMKDQGFTYSTVAGFTVSLFDIFVVEGKDEILAKADAKVNEIENRSGLGFGEAHAEICKIWEQSSDEIKKLLETQMKKFPRNPIFMMSNSGARGKLSNLLQLYGLRGLMKGTNNDTIEVPVRSSFREGMSVAEFFISTHGARKGGADTSLKTSDSGYLTRRLVDVSQDVIVREEDCHTDQGFLVSSIFTVTSKGEKEIVPLKQRIIGRFALHDIVDPKTGEVIVAGNTMIDEDSASTIIKAGIKEVEIRSIFGCHTKNGVCAHCYGRNLATGLKVDVGQAVGTMAAQSIGEPGTQLTMRTFHTGGVADADDITDGLPRVTDLFEGRNSKDSFGKDATAKIAKFNGTITEIIIPEENSGYPIIIKIKDDLNVEASEDTIFELRPNQKEKHLLVKVGDHVVRGQPLTKGPINCGELLAVAGFTAVQNYILKEIHAVYASQGIAISDKHIEIIIRQMLRRVSILSSNVTKPEGMEDVITDKDLELIDGSRISIGEITRINTERINNGEYPAFFAPKLLGISKAAIEADSFLSAASFQETTRVLTEAAINGKIDTLHGLKENVITGKLIPAGNGLLSEEEREEIVKNFSVKKKLDEINERYVEEHDRKEHDILKKFESKNSED